MPVADFKALRCQSPRLMVCGGEDHSWRWVRAAIRELTPATCRSPGRKRAPPHWPPRPDWRLALGISPPPIQPLASQGTPAPSGRCRRNQRAGSQLHGQCPTVFAKCLAIYLSRARAIARWSVRIVRKCAELSRNCTALEPSPPTSEGHTRMNWRNKTWFTVRCR